MSFVTKNLILALLITLSIVVARGMAEEANKEAALESLMKNISVNKTDVAGMIEKMKNDGMISEEEANAAKKDLNKMSQSDLDKVKSQATEMIKKGEAPTVVKENPNASRSISAEDKKKITELQEKLKESMKQMNSMEEN